MNRKDTAPLEDLKAQLEPFYERRSCDIGSVPFRAKKCELCTFRFPANNDTDTLYDYDLMKNVMDNCILLDYNIGVQ